MTKPYRAEFGAVHHSSASGFLFTVSPPSAADSVADALNKAVEVDQWRESVGVMLDEPDPDVVRVCEGGGPEDLIMSLVVTLTKTRKSRDAGWMTLEEAPLDVNGSVWSPDMPDRLDMQGRVGAYHDGERTVFARECQGVRFTYWRAFAAAPKVEGDAR